MNKQTIILILFVHWIADFICQSDWMAKNKSKRATPLLAHGLVYTAVLAILNPMWALINGLVHVAVDAVTSRITSRLYAANQIHWFFVVIGLDQFIHFTVLILTWTSK